MCAQFWDAESHFCDTSAPRNTMEPVGTFIPCQDKMLFLTRVTRNLDMRLKAPGLSEPGCSELFLHTHTYTLLYLSVILCINHILKTWRNANYFFCKKKKNAKVFRSLKFLTNYRQSLSSSFLEPLVSRKVKWRSVRAKCVCGPGVLRCRDLWPPWAERNQDLVSMFQEDEGRMLGDMAIIGSRWPFCHTPVFFCCQQGGPRQSRLCEPGRRVLGFSGLLIPARRCVLFTAQHGGLCQFIPQANFKDTLQSHFLLLFDIS